MKPLLTIFMLLIIVVTACGKRISISSFSDCNKKQNLDSGATAAKLLGSWKWTKRDCLGNNQSSPADKNVTVEFKTDSTFRVRQDTSSITVGSWQLAAAGSGVYTLVLSEPSVYLYGQLLFCDNELLFYDSFRDGCDHLFIKN